MQEVSAVVLEWLDGNITSDEAMQSLLVVVAAAAVGVVIDAEATEVSNGS